MSLQHLIDLHNVGIRLIALELITSAIKAKYEPTRTLPARSLLVIGCVWHVVYVREDKFEQTTVLERIEKKFPSTHMKKNSRWLRKEHRAYHPRVI